MRTKQEFRAIRERVGMTQAGLARRMRINVRSVRFWEDPDSIRTPPDEAWDILDNALNIQKSVLKFALGKVDEALKLKAGSDENFTVALPFWLNEEQYRKQSTDSSFGIIGDWHMANANNIALANILFSMGIDVVWTENNPARPEVN